MLAQIGQIISNGCVSFIYNTTMLNTACTGITNFIHLVLQRKTKQAIPNFNEVNKKLPQNHGEGIVLYTSRAIYTQLPNFWIKNDVLPFDSWFWVQSRDGRTRKIQSKLASIHNETSPTDTTLVAHACNFSSWRWKR